MSSKGKNIDYKERVQNDLKLLLAIGFRPHVAAGILKLIPYNDFYQDEYAHVRNRRSLLMSYLLRFLDISRPPR